MKVFIVDAFTKEAFSGNPEGVCIVDDEFWSNSALMQSIASEFGLSEVSFIKPNVINKPSQKFTHYREMIEDLGTKGPLSVLEINDDLRLRNQHGSSNQRVEFLKKSNLGLNSENDELDVQSRVGAHHYSIRWFTPNSEAPICGHATIASLHILVELGLVEDDVKIKFDSISGIISASRDSKSKLISLDLPSYEIEHIPYPQRFDSIIGDVRPIDTFYSQNCIAMNFADSSIVRDLEPDFRLLSKEPYRALIATSISGLEFADCDFVFRYFAPRVSIDEDHVCGSAHCRLIPYWSKAIGKNSFVSRALSKRGGLVYSEIKGNTVTISGHSVTVFEGHLRI